MLYVSLYRCVIMVYFRNSNLNSAYLHLSFPINFFSCAKLKQLFRKYPMVTQGCNETNSLSLFQYDLICPDGNLWHNGAMTLRYDLSCWQSAFCNPIWFVITPNYGTTAHWSNWYVISALQYDLSCWQSAFSNTIWFVNTATLAHRRSEATDTSLLINCDTICPDADKIFLLWYDCPAANNSSSYDTICPSSNPFFAMRSELTRQWPSLCIIIHIVLLLKKVFYYDMICLDSCETCL